MHQAIQSKTTPYTIHITHGSEAAVLSSLVASYPKRGWYATLLVGSWCCCTVDTH